MTALRVLLGAEAETALTARQIDVDLATTGHHRRRCWTGWTALQPRIEVDVLIRIDDLVAHAARMPGDFIRARWVSPPVVLRVQLRRQWIRERVDLHSGDGVSLDAVGMSLDA